MADQPPSAAVLAAVALLVGAAVGAGAVAVLDGTAPAADSDPRGTDADTDRTATPTDRTAGTPVPPTGPVAVETFDSAAAFRAYRARSGDRARIRDVALTLDDGPEVVRDDAADGPEPTRTAVATSTPTPAATPAPEAGDGDGGGGGGDAEAPRHSETNVRERGISEPDLVKTTGRTTYVVSHLRGGFEVRDGGEADVAVLNTSTPATPERVAEIQADGQLLRHGPSDTLLVLSNDVVRAFDVSDPAAPERRWERDVEGRIRAVRMQAGHLYLVTATDARGETPCPVEPLGREGPAVPCDAVYHPADPVPAEVTYTAVALDPANGTATANASFVGTGGAVVYASADGLYLTYADRTDRARAYLSFLLTTQRDRLPPGVLDRLERLRGYDLHSRALMAEVRATLADHYGTLNRWDRDRLRERIEGDWADYRREHRREFRRTGVVRFGLPGLEPQATGSVPGRPLNTFSLDERDGHLRVATTVGRGDDSVNDLYVLDEGLNVTGSVEGMGEGQRVYAVRFVGDTAYVVTFRQVDPLHVANLSDPADPELRGELKLPGFSSYLHPLGPDRILGVGEEDGAVKAVVFDVSDPRSPEVAADVHVDERWNAVRDTHRAFLIDRRHEVFFLPGREGGHVVSYDDGLAVETRVDVRGARRAAYVGDYMYVVGRDSVVVVDERTWERTATVDL
jgi:uncharacterized secreted protein with C-terminal beta-propeller domain